MSRSKSAVAAIGAIILSTTCVALAADLPGARVAPTPLPSLACADFSRIAVHREVDPSEMKGIVQEHYDLSRSVSEEKSTIYNASPRYLWADQTRVYCGMAIGYFAYGEFNDEAVGKCDCFYGQMRKYMVR